MSVHSRPYAQLTPHERHVERRIKAHIYYDRDMTTIADCVEDLSAGGLTPTDIRAGIQRLWRRGKLAANNDLTAFQWYRP